AAMGPTTDRLSALAVSVNPEPPARELDMLIANGEAITAPLVAMCLAGMGVPAISLSGAQAGVRTSGQHSRARIKDIKPDRIVEALGKNQVPVIAGFQGVTAELDITTLGRGGSDTTAVALAAALRAESCEIYTDVDGIFTADPRVVKAAKKLTHVQYDEMLELAAVGARIMHPRAVEIAELYSVPIHVRSSFHDRVGTMIVAHVPMEDRQRVRGIAQETNVAKITVVGVRDRPGVAATIFEPLAEAGINIEMISTSEIRITCLVSRDQVGKGVRILHHAFELDQDLAQKVGPAIPPAQSRECRRRRASPALHRRDCWQRRRIWLPVNLAAAGPRPTRRTGPRT